MLPEVLSRQLKDKLIGDYFEQHIDHLNSLLEVIDAIKSKTRSHEDDALFDALEPFIHRFKPTTSQILNLSHVFCLDCDLYVPSYPHCWIKNNSELWETDVYFFHLFFERFTSMVTMDVNCYALESLYTFEEKGLPRQSRHQKLKLLWTMVKNYKFIVKNMI